LLATERDGTPPSGGGRPIRPGEVDRRTVLKLIGGGAALGAAPRLGGGRLTRAVLASSALPALPAALPALTRQVFVYRREDLLDLRFDLYNLVLDASTPRRLVRKVATGPAFVVAVFPFQHLAEEAVQSPPAPPWPSSPLEALAPGPSQLVFALPKSLKSLPFTLAGLLDWTGLVPELEAVATGVKSALPAAPGALQSFVEAPWQLFLSPDQHGRWHHSAAPVTHGVWTELWQTRLGVGAVEPPASVPLIKAVWTPDWPDLGPADPFVMPLQPSDRRDIVTLTCGFDFAGVPPVPAKAVPVKLFMLTPLGASLDLEGSWNEPFVSSLTDWRHRMTTGRDSYVRIVRSGYLFPFALRAVWITITDREFQVSPSGDIVAYLVQRNYVEITQPTRTYEGASPEPYAGRRNPLRTITAKTLATPPLDPPSFIAGTTPTDQAFWVRSEGADVPFSFVAVDWEGRSFDFSASVIWVDELDADETAVADPVETEYSSPANLTRRESDLNGQLLAFADVTGAKPGSTAQHVDSLEFGGQIITDPLALTPAWYPYVASAAIRLPAAEQIAGTGGGSLPTPPQVQYPSQYYLNGFQAGLPEIFLQVVAQTQPLSIPPNLAGGMATPNFTIDGVARDLGPIADTAKMLLGSFDPTSFFGTLDAKILGAVSLADIIQAVTGADIADKAPKLNSAPVYPNNDDTKPPTALQTTLDWTPTVKNGPDDIFEPTGDKDNTLTIHVKIYTPVADPSKTTYDVDGQLVDFNLNLFGDSALFITVHFTKVHFTAKTGAKANVDVNVDKVTFAGPLTFINELESLFASLGGPSIDLEPTGVTASYSLPLPSIGIGVFAIENISLSGSLTIPFDGTPIRLQVDFCTRDNPFLLSIMMFTGGGFFGIGLGADGIVLIEVSLEFGASVSLDLGVASGGVSIMAGIYFSLAAATPPATGEVVTLTGFLQASGNLEVLGIISISIVFYLGFTYMDPGKCTGTATVTVSVKVLFFSASVSMTVTKTFGGSGDPTFAQAISQGEWDTYCAAFA
jgi:hypothetical protein